MIKNWLMSVFGPTSRYHIGDSVQTIHGDQELMVVVGIKTERNSKESIIQCQLFDSTEKRNKEVVFSENELEPFDWYHPKKRMERKAE